MPDSPVKTMVKLMDMRPKQAVCSLSSSLPRQVNSGVDERHALGELETSLVGGSQDFNNTDVTQTKCGATLFNQMFGTLSPFSSPL